jgi:glycosyltransferase involved in cell wall biosynthesis
MRKMNGVNYHDRLPNHEIHRLMHSHDVLLFPTLDESLGWVAVEAALAGMPAVTTDIFAIPELVIDGKTGFLIPLNKNELSRWKGLWLNGAEFEQEVTLTFDTMQKHIVRALLTLANNPDLAITMGQAARNHIHLLYGFEQAQHQLSAIYADALGR